MHLRLDAATLDPRAVRKEIARYLAVESTSDSDLGAAELIVGELLSNVLRYAPGPVEVSVAWNDEFASLTVADSGPGFKYPALKRGFRDENGRGLFLIESLARAVQVKNQPGVGATVIVVLPVRRRQ